MTRLAVLLEQCLAPVPGGTGRYSRELAAALAATAPPGTAVAGWTAYHRDLDPARIDGLTGPHRLPLPRRALVAAWERGQGPAPDAELVFAPTPLAPPRRGRPLVVAVHDAVPWTHPHTLTPRGVQWHKTMIERAAKEADAVVTPTRAVADELATFVSGIEKKLHVVTEGVSKDLVLPDNAEARVAGMALPERYWLSLATLEPRKGLDVLLEALAKDEGLPPLLVVGQPGWGGVDPLAEAKRLGLEKRVRVLGKVSDADLAVLLDRALALVAPSRSEGFGLPSLEAMSFGTPVVSSDAPALVEVAGGAALVVKRDDPAALAEALDQVNADEGLRVGLVEKGRIRARDFSWEAGARALWQVYDEL